MTRREYVVIWMFTLWPQGPTHYAAQDPGGVSGVMLLASVDEHEPLKSPLSLILVERRRGETASTCCRRPRAAIAKGEIEGEPEPRLESAAGAGAMVKKQVKRWEERDLRTRAGSVRRQDNGG